MSESQNELIAETKTAPAKYKRKLGDRKDGRRLRTLEPLAAVLPFFMKSRNDANNLAHDSVELSIIDKYVHEKKAEGKLNLNAMHVLIAAYVRTVSQKPGINRFVSGYRIFARNDISVIMEVKKRLELNAPATMMKFHFSPYATIDDVYKEMNDKITAYWNESEDENNLDSFLKILYYIPRWVLRSFEKILELLDYNGWIPNWLTEISPMHGSLVITSMASLNIPSIYHHLYNFGNVPMFISFSTNRHEYELDREGVLHRNHYLDINYTCDDRICDGHYYASGLREIRKYLKNPHLLDTPPEKVVDDID